jgi:glycosyltransferase involved in cell wall biosynthesis
VGFREDVWSELATLDIVVHASIVPEPGGQVVLEAMAAGVPVVAADAGGPAEVIEDGVTGLLYPPGNVAALAEALQTLAADEALRARLAEAGRQRVANFAPETVARQVMALYRGLLSPGGRGR